MKSYLFLSFTFLKFWFFELPIGLIAFFASVNSYFMQLFALPLCIRTYFKPLKNEYRQGLVGFSRAMGIFVKTGLIITDLFLLIALLLIEIIVAVSFTLFPLISVWILFI